jgi:hypothetical protein
MKIENLVSNSSISFIGYLDNNFTLHGIRIEDGVVRIPNFSVLNGVSIGLYELRKDSSEILIEGNYLTVTYSNDHEEQESLELLFQKFFSGFEKPVNLEQIEIIHDIIRRFGSRKKTEIGLIGELIFIASNVDKNAAIKAWHTSKDTIFDFNFQSEIFEVKCTTGLQRKHRLNQRQNRALSVIDDKRAFYVSVVLNRNFPKDDINSLVKIISLELDEDVRSLFHEKLNEYKYLLESRMKFDLLSSLKSIKVFDARLFSDIIEHSNCIESADINFSLNFNLLIE